MQFLQLLGLALAQTSFTLAKRSLLWDYTNSVEGTGVPWLMDQVNFNVISSVSNWNAWVPPELRGRAPFRPMIRTQGELSGNDWNTIWNSDQPIIHFFNEPERQGISPQQAADIWHNQVLQLRWQRGKQLVSPSCSNDQAGQDWINEWMNLVSDNPPDYLGLHYYGTDGNAMISFLEGMHNRHGRQIFVSEWASISPYYDDVKGMTIQLVNYMDGQNWISEHSLFACVRQLDGFVPESARLELADGSGFTDLFYKYQYDVPMHW